MNTSVIRYRVADFLRRFPPFDSLPEADVLDLAGNGRVKFHQAGEFLYRQGQAKGSFVWMIQQGRVDILEEIGGRPELRDVAGEGDLLGLDRFVGAGSCQRSACTANDVIAYALQGEAFENLAHKHASLKRYLAAHFSISGLGVGRASWLDAEAPPISFLQERSIFVPDSSDGEERKRLLQAAKNNVVGVLDEQGNAFGYVDREGHHEFRSAMSDVNTRQAIRQMMKTNSDVVAITSTADFSSPPVAVLTGSDLSLFSDRNPMRMLVEVRSASSVAELAQLLRQADRMVFEALAHAEDVDDCALMSTEFLAAASEACIRFAHQDVVRAGIEPPRAKYGWVAFGKLARGENLRLTPPRIGIVYGESGDFAADASYFAAMTGQTSGWFEACGLPGTAPEWPDGSHSFLSLADWKQFYLDTISRPLDFDLFARRELFDLRGLSGEASLVADLKHLIVTELQKPNALIPMLANDTLSHQPPLTLFRGLVLESDGAERQGLDLAKLVLNPISDAARVFSLEDQATPAVNTLDRLESAAITYAPDADVFRNAGDAFRFALYHQAVAGTSILRPDTLSRLDQRLMKTAFSSILRLLELTASRFVPS